MRRIPFLKNNILSSSLTIFLLPIAVLLTGCGSGHDDYHHLPPAGAKPTIFVDDFNNGIDGWKVGFSDYPAGQETFYELTSGFVALPVELGANRKGLNVSGNNHSDDLYMFITRKITGLEPNTRYDLEFEVSFGSNVASGCSGVGGAPGEGVTIKAGASKIEPVAVNNGAGHYLMNIDKGNQAVGGSDAIAIGNFANGRSCESAENSYLKKTLKSEKGAFSTFSAADGSLWILFSTDSGYEATTSIYYMNTKVIATKR